jgi:hypothetical protein
MSWFGWLRRVTLPSLFNLAVAWLLIFGLPQFTGLPITTLWLLNPDFGRGIIAGAVIGFGWGILWPLQVYFSLGTQIRQRRTHHVPAGA